MTKKEELSLEEIEKALVDFYDKKLLEEKNPYKDGFLDDAVDNFCDALKNEKEFSWLNEFGIDDKENGKANVNYGLPTHVHGDYENGLIYICLKNPGDQVSDDKSFENIRDYYDTYAEKTRNTLENIEKSNGNPITYFDKDKDYKFYEDMNKKILSWKDNDYKLDKDSKENKKEDLKENIKEYIFSDKTSILTKELIKIKKLYKENCKNNEKCKKLPKKWEDLKAENIVTRNVYYTWTYFKPLLTEYDENIEKSLELIPDNYELYGNNYEKIEEIITNNIVNLELCPFRSQNAKAVSDLNKTVYGKFSAYIILNRLGKYLKDGGKKPLFIFRSYSDWNNLFKDCIYEILEKEYLKKNMDDALLELRAKYFYFFPTSASISKASIRKFTNQEEYQEFVDVLNNESN